MILVYWGEYKVSQSILKTFLPPRYWSHSPQTNKHFQSFFFIDLAFDEGATQNSWYLTLLRTVTDWSKRMRYQFVNQHCYWNGCVILEIFMWPPCARIGHLYFRIPGCPSPKKHQQPHNNCNCNFLGIYEVIVCSLNTYHAFLKFISHLCLTIVYHALTLVADGLVNRTTY